MKRLTYLAWIVAAGAVILIVAYVARHPLLVATGKFLERTDVPVPADVIVVVRGDEVYFDRALTAAGLFRRHLASRIYVSSALSDLAAPALQAHGVAMPTAQDGIASVLMQREVPCEQILLDRDQPGGGTAGEVNRIRAMLATRGYSSALLVTSWYHARRLRWLLDRSFKDSKMSFAIVAAEEPTNAANWWRRRYIAIAVLEEYVKLIMSWLSFEPGFEDDPHRVAAQLTSPHC